MVKQLALSGKLRVLGTVGAISADETHAPRTVTRGTEGGKMNEKSSKIYNNSITTVAPKLKNSFSHNNYWRIIWPQANLATGRGTRAVMHRQALSI